MSRAHRHHPVPNPHDRHPVLGVQKQIRGTPGDRRTGGTGSPRHSYDSSRDTKRRQHGSEAVVPSGNAERQSSIVINTGLTPLPHRKGVKSAEAREIDRRQGNEDVATPSNSFASSRPRGFARGFRGIEGSFARSRDGAKELRLDLQQRQQRKPRSVFPAPLRETVPPPRALPAYDGGMRGVVFFSGCSSRRPCSMTAVHSASRRPRIRQDS